MNADICRWTRAGIQCQRSKIHRHTLTPLSSFPSPDDRLNTVHFNLVGHLPPSRGYGHLLTCVDHFTRWLEAFPLLSITADTVAHTFVSRWIARSIIITDRGRQFESTLWQSLMTFLGSKRVPTTSYHPQANSMVFPSTTEDCHKDTFQFMDGCVTTGHARDTDSSERGHTPYCS